MAQPADPHRRNVSARNTGVEPGVGQRLAAELAPMPISDPDRALVTRAIEDALAATNFATSTALSLAQQSLVFAKAGGLLIRRAARADLALALAYGINEPHAAPPCTCAACGLKQWRGWCRRIS